MLRRKIQSTSGTTQGQQGEKGIAGIQGDKGIAGIQGENGIQGDKGIAGIQGENGIAGIQGDKGIAGIAGDDVKGQKGEPGQDATAQAGSKGDKGIAGVAGENVKGQKGEAGQDATAQAGSKGDKGIQGQQGDKGIAGVAGEDVKGQKGEAGQDATAQAGSKGDKGIAGIAGDDVKGQKGESGQDGNGPFDANDRMTGHIIPASGQGSQFDLGNAEHKIRHLFLSDNSIWIGDKNKITVRDGDKVDFVTRAQQPPGIPQDQITAAIQQHGKTSASEMTLEDWTQASGLEADQLFPKSNPDSFTMQPDQVEVVTELPLNPVNGQVVLCDTLDTNNFTGKVQLAFYVKGYWWRIDLASEEWDTQNGV
jgi:hypothetical protein